MLSQSKEAAMLDALAEINYVLRVRFSGLLTSNHRGHTARSLIVPQPIGSNLLKSSRSSLPRVLSTT